MDSAEHTLRQALDYRERVLGSDYVRSNQAALRLLTCDEGIHNLSVDRYGETIVFQRYGSVSLSSLHNLVCVLERRLGARSFVLKEFVCDRSHVPHFRERSIHFAGSPAPNTVQIQESGLFFTIRPNEGFSTGLFLDQRLNRGFLATLCESGIRVLNLFAYTCSFSVYCANRGASTVSVDISKKALEWGRTNFSNNDIALSGHRFLCRDSLSFLEGASHRGESFDLIIIDPPSFSRTSDGKVFKLTKDFWELLEMSAICLAPGGHVFFSTNNSQMIEKGLPKTVGNLIKSDRTLPLQPGDFVKGKPTIVCGLFEQSHD